MNGIQLPALSVADGLRSSINDRNEQLIRAYAVQLCVSMYGSTLSMDDVLSKAAAIEDYIFKSNKPE